MTRIFLAPFILPQQAFLFVKTNLPGVLLCLLISCMAMVLEAAETFLLGKAWLESLNLALLLGVFARTLYEPGLIWADGIKLCSKTLLNIAIVLLGASFSLNAVLCAGPLLLVGIMGVVLFSIIFTYGVGRVIGLPTPQLLLVACGNAICGNSAIMAAAPVIRAKDEDVGATIAFTAAGGLVVVLCLPLLVPTLHMSQSAQGALAGLTVYAVPQVVAAAAPFGLTAVHVGTLVKLMRVLMLGPVCIGLSLLAPKLLHMGAASKPPAAPYHLPFSRLMPWYITGFFVMMIARSLSIIPTAAVAPLGFTATNLTILAMAALGLSVDLRSVIRAGKPLVLTVCFSLVGLIGASLALVKVTFCD